MAVPIRSPRRSASSRRLGDGRSRSASASAAGVMAGGRSEARAGPAASAVAGAATAAPAKSPRALRRLGRSAFAPGALSSTPLAWGDTAPPRGIPPDPHSPTPPAEGNAWEDDPPTLPAPLAWGDTAPPRGIPPDPHGPTPPRAGNTTMVPTP